MWLDRFSNHPTPNGSPPPQNKSLSSATRRPNHLTPVAISRPGISHRSSSLSLISKANSSSTSLAGTARTVTGSSVKHEIAPPLDVHDPLEVIKNIIELGADGARTRADSSRAPNNVGRPEELITDVEFDGLSLDTLKTASYNPDVVVHQYRTQLVEECEYVYLAQRSPGIVLSGRCL